MKTKSFVSHAVRARSWMGIAGLLLLMLSAHSAHGAYDLYISPVPIDGSQGYIVQPTNVASVADYLKLPYNVTTDPIAIEAVSTGAYVFANWELVSTNLGVTIIDTNSGFSAIQYSGTEDVTVRAHFKVPEYKLTLVDRSPAGATGNIYRDPVAVGDIYTNGTLVELTADADSGSYFYEWTIGSDKYHGTVTNVLMVADKTVFYEFRKVDQLELNVRSTNSAGRTVGSPQVIVDSVGYDGSGKTHWDYGTDMSIRVDPEDVIDAGERAVHTGWNRVSGSGGIDSGIEIVPTFDLTNDTEYVFKWITQYKLTVEIILPDDLSASGDVSRSPVGHPAAKTNAFWYNKDQSVDLTAVPVLGFFSQWGGDAAGVNRNIQIVMDGPKIVQAFFAESVLDNDNDGLPDNWEAQFGLDPDDGALLSDSGPYGDPDNDGVVNLLEFRISYIWLTNQAFYAVASPINADSDGDGMDDGYELAKILNLDVIEGTLPVPGNQANAMAVVTPTGVYGQNGNPDEDFHWSTTTGYETERNLINYEEYVGPDGRRPGEWPAVAWPGITEMVQRFEPNIDDTMDQSSSDVPDSETSGGEVEGDGFDDGFEYTWDQWQRNNTNDEVFVIGYHGQSITNPVPVWDGVTNLTRRFNPATLHADLGIGTGNTDFDVLYDYETGGVSYHWYSDDREYNAWQDTAFNGEVGGDAPTSIVRPDYPDRRRSSHPFMMDFDLDGLPDGYEVIFGLDPWVGVTAGSVAFDGERNLDDDWMAYNETTSNAHHEVYQADEFDPRTGFAQTYPQYNNMPGKGSSGAPNTKRYANLDETRGPDGLLMLVPLGLSTNTEDATDPRSPDSDADGMWDGWECYVGLNPNSGADAAPSADGNDKLSNFEEFSSFLTSSTNRNELVPLTDWLNKIFPTDPNDVDTDGDGIKDGDEKALFNGNFDILTYRGGVFNTPNEAVAYSNATVVAGVWAGKCYTAGGLNPTSADTENDGMPDPWEAMYSAAVYGTVDDIYNDPDNDRLVNYQEYRVAATYHWQWDFWSAGQPSYDPADFFLGTPKHWDWYTSCRGRTYTYIPYLGPNYYSSTDPGDVDTDEDGMDDYYEIFHGLNPLYGVYDITATRIYGPPLIPAGVFQPLTADPRVLPCVAGSIWMDPDADGLINDEEGVGESTGGPVVPTHHTDPTPYWINDTSYPNSWLNLYYTPNDAVWYWSILSAPDYAFDVEFNEGYETDNDNEPDYDEAVYASTDPVNHEGPIKRRALYLPPGLDAYARTKARYYHSFNALRTFTVESWVRPIEPASGAQQVIVERPCMVPQGNPMDLSSGVRLNFRIGLDGDGIPFAAYNGSGTQLIFVEAKAAPEFKLLPDQWTHLAATYELQTPDEHGRLTLYVNGELAGFAISDEIPCNGRFGSGGTVFVISSPVVVGAADENPWGSVDAFSSYQPAPVDFYSGWVDEVKVWHGALSQNMIVSNAVRKARTKQMHLGNFGFDASLVYLFTFDDLQDPDHDGIAPEGFDVTMSAIRPVDWPAITWWSGANDRSMVYTDYQYLPWIQNTVGHAPINPPLDVGDPSVVDSVTTVVTNFDGSVETNVAAITLYPNTGNPYGTYYLTAPSYLNDDFVHVGDMLPLRWAEADEDVEMWDGIGPDTDTDGDGMTDLWEEENRLDPLSVEGYGSPDADPDADGLVNLYEYLAQAEFGVKLDPWKFGTFSTNVISDYYMVPTGEPISFGEMYDDMDILPDGWEREYQDVMSRYYYHRDQDPDGDGWNNQEEYLVGTDPSDPSDRPNPIISGQVRYSGVIDNAGSPNGVADFIQVLAYGTPEMDLEPMPAIVSDVFGVNNVINFSFQNGVPSREIYIFAYKSAEDSANTPFTAGNDYGVVGPVFVGLTGDTNVEINIMIEPEMPWFNAFEWANPVGLSDVFVRLYDVNNENTLILTRWIHLDRNWYEQVPFSYPSPTSWLRSENTAFHAADYMEGTPTTGMDLRYGLPPGNFMWQVASNDLPVTSQIFDTGMFNIPNYPLPAVDLVTPFGGDIIRHQIHTFKWQTPNPSYVPRFEVEMGPTNGAWAIHRTIAAPWHDLNGVYSFPMPAMEDSDDLFGDANWPNGHYQWRVRPHNNSVPGNWTDYGLFELLIDQTGDPAAAGVPHIYGKVDYLGKASTNRVFVQAYKSPSFRGRVAGQARLSSLGEFTISGLRNELYYLYAYADLNTNGVPDEWEPQGMARDDTKGLHYEFRADDYSFGSFDMRNRNEITGVSILMRDRDTDNDNVPDGWEWEHMHNSPHGMFHTGDEDLDGDGLSNMDEYGLDTDPVLADTDGDGLSDGTEVDLGLKPGNSDDDADGVPTAMEVAWGGIAGNYQVGVDMNPGSPDTDNDTVGDLMEIAAGSDPLNPAEANKVHIMDIEPDGTGGTMAEWNIHRNDGSIDVTFVLQFSPDLVLWADITGYTSDGDTDARVSLADGERRLGAGFYRLRMEIE